MGVIVTGAVASFNTEYKPSRINSVVAGIAPVQSGTGDPSPTNVRPISGWTGVAGQRTGKNLFAGYGEHTYIKPNTAYFLSSGSLTGGKRIRFQVYDNTGTLITSPTVANSPNYYASGNVIVRAGDTTQLNDALTITNTTAAYIVAIDDSGAPFYYPNFQNVQLELGSTATAYTPYTGEQITVEFPALGTNQWDEQWEMGTFNTSNGNNLAISNQIRAKNRIPVSPSTSYCLVNKGAGTAWMIFYDTNGQVITEGLPTGNRTGNSVGLTDGKTFITPSNCTSVRFYMTATYGATYGNNISINYPATATAYEPYTNTVYGGTVDPTTGVLTVTHYSFTIDGVKYYPSSSVGKEGSGRWEGCWRAYDYFGEKGFSGVPCAAAKLDDADIKMSRFENDTVYQGIGGCNMVVTGSTYIRVYIDETQLTDVSSLAAALASMREWLSNNPIQVSYALRDPITYQLTPQQAFSILAGQNSIWFDTGDTTVDWEQLVLQGVDVMMRRRNILAGLPHIEEKSGTIASFNTDIAAPLKACQFAIEPMQDLHGQTGPYPEGVSKNIWDEQWELGDISTSTGEFISDGDKYLVSSNYIPVRSGTTYCIVSTKETGSSSGRWVIYQYASDHSFLYSITLPAQVTTFTTNASAAYIKFRTFINNASQTYQNCIAVNYPSSVNTYQPHSNICPITGWTGLNGQRTGKNLFDISTAVSGFVTSTGTAIGAADKANLTSDFISVKEGVTYTYRAYPYNEPTGSEWTGYAFYSAKDMSSAIGTRIMAWAHTAIFTVPQGAKYVRIGSRYLVNGDAQLEVGGTVTDLALYAGDTIPVEFPAQGKNLYNIADASLNMYYYWFDNTKVIQQSSDLGLIAFPCKPSTTYTVSSSRSVVQFACCYIKTATVEVNAQIYGRVQNSRGAMNNPITITTGTDATFLLVWPYNNLRGEESYTYEQVLSAVQIELGSTATSYEPYTNTVYSGKLDALNGVLTVDRKYALLNDASLWVTSSGAAVTYYYNKNFDDRKLYDSSVAGAICSYLPVAAGFGIFGRWRSTTSPNFAIKDNNGVLDLNTLKQDASANKIAICYELATPITYQLTPQQITTLKGMNNVWCDTGNTTVKYWKH